MRALETAHLNQDLVISINLKLYLLFRQCISIKI